MDNDELNKPFADFISTIAKATNETSKREAFVILASKGFEDTGIATELALGAEYKVNFKNKGAIRRGAVDSFFGNLIVEFENNMARTGNHAVDQLRAYSAGAWTEDGSTERPYIAIATDGLEWRVFAPTVHDNTIPVDKSDVVLHQIERCSIETAEDAGALRDFLNRVLYRKITLAPSAENIARDFGLESQAYVQTRDALTKKLESLNSDPQFETLRTAWEKALVLAYGNLKVSNELFVQHTYLAIVARLLIWSALERRPLGESETEDVLSGLYFRSRNISNIAEHDYFWWHLIPGGMPLEKTLVAVSKQLATYDLTKVKEDILKPIYEQLVDPVTRHELGEFYTPDWLAERVVTHLLAKHDYAKEGLPKILDPACGSGSFLRVCIHEVRTNAGVISKAELLDKVRSSVVGIDVHPLAVIIARATYLLAVSDLIEHAVEPVSLPVYLANSLKVPVVYRQTDAFGADDFRLEVGAEGFQVPADLIFSGAVYDDVIDEVAAVASSFGSSRSRLSDIPRTIRSRLHNVLERFDTTGKLEVTICELTREMAKLVRQRRDSVHAFMLKNHYRPAMLRGTFDYVVGNPPWLTIADISTPDYAKLVVDRVNESRIAPRGAGQQSHTELASLFIVAAVEDFLKKKKSAELPNIAFLMPRSVMTASHHGNLRGGSYKPPFKVQEIWDLKDVSPLFKIPCCCLFITGNAAHQATKPKKGLILKGILPKKECHLSSAQTYLRTTNTKFHLRYLARTSAWVADTEKARGTIIPQTAPPYARVFEQGAIIYPQTLFIAGPTGAPSRKKGSVKVVTSDAAKKTAKKGKNVSTNHIVDTKNLFYTAAAEHILPYSLDDDLWVTVLPTVSDPGKPDFAPASSHELRANGLIHTAKWLEWAQKQWESLRKSGDKSELHERIDYSGHLTAQSKQQRYLVLYASSGKRPVASCLDTTQLEIPFVARDKTYWGSFKSSDEAFYLVGYLNSDFLAKTIDAWINKGLFGNRDINKLALYVPWPIYDSTNVKHRRLARVAKQLSAASKKLLSSCPVKTAGRRRAWVREHLQIKFRTEIETLVKEISPVA